MCTTIEGKTDTCLSGAEMVPPRLTESCTLAMARSTTTLPAVLPVISMACRIGTPACTSAERVRDQRASATFWTTSPIFMGMRKRKVSHCGRPFFDFFHFRKPHTDSAVTPISTYHRPVTKCETPTVTWVSAGSLPRSP